MAKLRDSSGKPVTNLTTAIVESVGGDQMSILHTRTHFTDRVSILLNELNNNDKFKYDLAPILE